MRLRGSEMMADMLEGYGVTHVFFVPTILNHTLYQIEQRTQIDRILAHSEKAAAYMADGYARSSGRVGICMAQMVGAGNLAAGLRDGAMASSPIISITGGSFPNSRDRYQFQEMDDSLAFRAYVKSSTRVDTLERLGPTIRQAFRTATSGRPGISHIELLNHHGDGLELVTGDLDPSADPRFANLPPFRTSPQADDVDEAAQLLASAEQPVIVAGGGVRHSGARTELLALAEELSIPVATTLTGMDVIPTRHHLAVGVTGLYCSPAANEVVNEADLVFFLGTKTGSQMSLNWTVPSKPKKVIQADIAGDTLGLNYRNDVSLEGDALATIRALRHAISSRTVEDRSSWTSFVRSTVEGHRESQARVRRSGASPMRPERLFTDLSSVLPDDAVVVSDTGHTSAWAAGHLEISSPDQVFLRAAGSLGWALPASIGAQCALPDKPVVCVTGDGGAWYHLAELETAKRWDIPVTFVVNNNNAFNQEIPLWEEAYGGELNGRHSEMWEFREVSFSALAREMGVKAVQVEHPDGLSGALEDAIEASEPRLVEVVTDKWAVAPKPSAGAGPE